MTSVRASAPGKLVLTGEYAVLTGAPALVVAVDRRARCTLEPIDAPEWRFVSHGFSGRAVHTPDALREATLEAADPARIAQAVIAALDSQGVATAALPAGLAITLDSQAFFDGPIKLGLGSSAALTVALTQAFITLSGASVDVLSAALKAHRVLQGGRGSGLDVAAAFTGGLIAFRRDAATDRVTVTPQVLPAGLTLAWFWTGASAATVDHVDRFDKWRQKGAKPELDRLEEAAEGVIDALPAADRFMRQLRAYSDRLRVLDDASGIGIYSAAHSELAALASAHEVVYKPSGAGGGDVGVAVARSADAIATFTRAAAERGVTALELSMEQHGITVSRE